MFDNSKNMRGWIYLIIITSLGNIQQPVPSKLSIIYFQIKQIVSQVKQTER